MNRAGQALVSPTGFGASARHVLAWNAINAVPPSEATLRPGFRLDYSGGWGTYRKLVWKTFRNACRPYAGPPLAWFVTGCTAPDGSLWALQSWQRALPNYGVAPTARQAVWELRLSHWTGRSRVLTIHLDWAYRRYDHLFGSLTYRRRAACTGSARPRSGNPLDAFGRNIYVDTFDSRLRAGLASREQLPLASRAPGTFCYGFYPHGDHPVGKGTQYRATAIGPGVTPDVMWQSAALGPYDACSRPAARRGPARDRGSDPLCRAV